jgi:hypothetical protein
MATVAFAVTAVACGSGGGTVRSDKPRPLDLHVGSPGASSVPVAAARGALVPGTYYTSRFLPAFRFEVSGRWKLEAESRGLVYLTRGSFPDDFVDLYLFVPGHEQARVVEPPLVRDDQPPQATIAPFPQDYVDYIARSPYLDAGPPTPGDLFGLHGTFVDAVVAGTPPGGMCAGAPGTCFSLFRYGPAAVSEQVEAYGSTLRVWSLDSKDGQLIAIFAARDPAQLNAGTELSVIVDSVRFQ